MKNKDGKIFGIPYPVVLFIFFVVAPLLLSDYYTRTEIKRSEDRLSKVVVESNVVPTTPVASASPTIIYEPTVTPKIKISSRSGVLRPVVTPK